MKERIIALLKKHPLSRKVILEFFSPSQEVNKNLDLLIEEGKIVFYNHKFYLPYQLSLVKGVITTIKDRFSFAKLENQEDDAYIDNSCLNGAFIGDEVYLQPDRSSGYLNYIVISILKRNKQLIVGELKKTNNNNFILLTKDIAQKNVIFKVRDSEVNLFEGYIVRAYVLEQDKNICYVKVVSIIGNKNDPGVDIERIILNHGADIDFPLDVISYLKTIPQKVEEKDLVGREDFTSHLIVTIDGEDAKDFDDAVEVERISNGYRVGVHIADVSYYCKEDSPLDKEAYSRGTSIYVTDRVVPMLPFELSNGICSLNPNVKRLVHSCIFEMDNDGNIISSRIVKGIIISKARLTYTYVNKLFKHQLDKNEHISEEVDQMLYILNEAARKIRKKRNKNGALSLDSTELKFICDEDGNPYQIIRRKQDEAEELIEDLMISANEIVSQTIEKLSLPFAYRIHEQPKSKKIESFMKLSEHLGYKCNFSSIDVTPRELSSHLDKIKEDNIKEIMSMMLLRSLQKARYCSDNKGHFGLASHSYCHFTSPIRRYPDLLVHRLIDRYLIDQNLSQTKELAFYVDDICENSSTKERRALSIEREVIDLESAKYMRDKIGNVYSGIVDGMNANGFFVEIDLGIDGYIDFETLDDDFYYFDDAYMQAIGRHHGNKIKLGDSVKVLVSSVDVENYKICFTLLKTTKNIKIVNRDKRRKKKRGR